MAIEELGRYKIEGVLGEGAMGVVYRARDPLLERIVAIKTIRIDTTSEDNAVFQERFFREAKSAARLNHPAIVTVFDAGEVGGIAYIAMELLEGQDLRQIINGEGMRDFDRIADIAARVADGLDYAHANGVIHRDIKPANIIITNEGQVKIADFGIAKLGAGSMTMTGMILGTPRYMSPEQITGEEIDGRSDIFSLGIVLYQLLTGVAPFDGSTFTNIMYRLINEPALMPTRVAPDVPKGFETILARALAKSPAKRYQAAGDMAADLRRYRELADSAPPRWSEGGLGDANQPAWRPGPNQDVSYQAMLVAAPDMPALPETMSDEPTLRLERPPQLAVAAPVAAPVAGPVAADADVAALAAAPAVDVDVTLLRPPQAAARPRRRWLLAAGLAVPVLVAALWLRQPQPAAPAVDPAPPAPTATPTGTPEAAAPVAVPAEPPRPVAAPPDAAAASKGTVAIAFAVSPWGEVYVDGESRGVSPPLREVRVEPGRRRIEIRNGDAPPFRSELDISPGDAPKIRHKF